MRGVGSLPTLFAFAIFGCGAESAAPLGGHDGGTASGGTSAGAESGTSSGGAPARREAGLGPRGADASDSGTVQRAVPTFRKIVLTNTFYAEGAGYGDFDRNGTTDVVSGPYWYEGPAFTTKHAVYAATAFDPHGYSDNFLEFVRDFDGDGYPDVLVVNYPGKDASIYSNSKQADTPWTRHQVVSSVSVESPAFTDLTGDGSPELVFAFNNRLGWGGPIVGTPYQPWTFHGASSGGTYSTFTHGLGVGDVNGDGRADLIEATGIWLQPASLSGDPAWSKSAQDFGSGGAQMFAVDVDGDGDRDIVTSLAAHGYGIAWFEQLKSAGQMTFTRHLIASDDPYDAGDSVVIHQPHALDLADIDEDGLPDVVTGERFWGHVPAGNPDINAPAKLYWFSLERSTAGARFVPHLVDDASGVGTQVVAADVNDDGRIDIVTGNKKGAFVFLQD